MDKAIQDGSIKCFNMRESVADRDQDLQFGCGKPHLGGLSVAKTDDSLRKEAALKELSLCGAETSWCHKADWA